MNEQAWRRIDELAPELWDLALRIHAHPELGFEEHQAAAWLSEALEKGGFRIERGAGGVPTAFRAVHPAAKPGPRVALLAEYDALPELGHACGHNLIAVIAVGAALGLATLKKDLPGTLVVLGTPAEEGGYIAFNPETGTTTQGETIEEALTNLSEATALYLSEFPMELNCF